MDNGASSYRRFLDGDDEGIVEIIRDYKDGLILYINSITGNISVAEEFMEETFVKLVIKKPRFRGKCSFKTWLYTIGRNVAFDSLKKNRNNGTDIIEEYHNIPDKENLERDYIKKEQKIVLHKTIGKLNSEYQQVLYLIYFEDFDKDEAAEIMKKSRKQIDNLVYRAKMALKKELERRGFVYEEL